LQTEQAASVAEGLREVVARLEARANAGTAESRAEAETEAAAMGTALKDREAAEAESYGL